MDVVEATRTHAETEHGASPRATIVFLNTARARAAIHGRDYVIPDDVKELAVPILVHRIILSTEAALDDTSSEDVIDEILTSVVPPGGGEESLANPETIANE